ncbi:MULTISPECIES: hypothetical protein [Streptomyces]|uniref:DUF8175 domain-containing protein n=1 Tax=Streptomyces morookaense TaxID=1970 RepID=A0A7Y7BA59_STRMO|nr:MULTISPECIES: hypothetical protein [Streptomyces]MCC2278564.1 hypothetical protein [Streptomyces sp. ET3-23]NVK81845.1 hypothetical protein [Streptomyces morookaense]GHF19162.1 hypothetical protein GCM10010359_21080 [Streptomyces morookaense]
MSLGDDGYGDDRHMTRTRLPEGEFAPHAQPRRGLPSRRNLMTVVGVVVLLIAAIAFANRGGGNSGSGNGGSGSGADKGASSRATAPTGTKPVEGKGASGLPSGFAHSEQGAASAAANFAVSLVSADILKPQRRHQIVEQIFTGDKAPELQTKLDAAYSKDFLAKLGLNENGDAAKGMTYVSRTVPVGTKATEYSDSSASVDVWCTGVFGTAGTGSTTPVANDWFTMTIKLRWVDNDWKAEAFSQKDGPAPVNSDRTASTADEIAKAVEQYGGFTYAR